MRKALRRVKKALMSGSSSHDSSSHTRSDSVSLDSSRSASYVPSPQGAGQLSYPPTQAEDVVEDDTDISICNHEELVRLESLHGI
jgi:hypothetical protein